MERSGRGIGKGGAARYAKVKSPKMKSPSKNKKTSPKPEISIRGIGKGGAARYRKSPKVKSPQKLSLDDTIEIDPLIIQKARQLVKEENQLRKKFKIPKEYRNDKLEDIPLSQLKINRKSKSPVKRRKSKSPKRS
jgi:hypothetical protein